MYNFIRSLKEGKELKTLDRIKLDYPLDGLGRSISKQTMDLHYGKLYKSYVDRFNASKGDLDFNEAGAFLHSKYFSQFAKPKNNNQPTSACLELIKINHKDFEDFKDKFFKTAMTIQGSGWIYLARDGEIKTIKNHQIKNDIVLIIDWWEHAFILDFGSDKEKYLEAQWRIIDWPTIEQRI